MKVCWKLGTVKPDSTILTPKDGLRKLFVKLTLCPLYGQTGFLFFTQSIFNIFIHANWIKYDKLLLTASV